MKRLMQKFEDIMVAITFAEAGEYDTCHEILGTQKAEDEVTVPQTETAQKTL